MDDPHRGIYISTLLEDYTVLLDVAKDRTGVYCENCEEWVAEFNGDALTTRTPEQFRSLVESEHAESHPATVEFSSWTESFK